MNWIVYLFLLKKKKHIQAQGNYASVSNTHIRLRSRLKLNWVSATATFRCKYYVRDQSKPTESERHTLSKNKNSDMAIGGVAGPVQLHLYSREHIHTISTHNFSVVLS